MQSQRQKLLTKPRLQVKEPQAQKPTTTKPQLKEQAQEPTTKPMPWFIFFLMTATAVMQGCSVMPYQETSSCQYNDLGKCIAISDAYNEAIKKPQDFHNSSLDYQPNNSNITNQSNNSIVTSQPNNSNQVVHPNNSSLTAQPNHQAVLYRKMQSIIDSDETPLLRPAVVRRVLINAYKSKDSSVWSEPRHLYYIEQAPQWILDSPNRKKAKQQNYLNF